MLTCVVLLENPANPAPKLIRMQEFRGGKWIFGVISSQKHQTGIRKTGSERYDVPKEVFSFWIQGLGSCTTWREACGLRLLMFTSFIRASEFSKLQTNFAGNLKSAADFPAEVYEMRKYKVSLQQSEVEKCTLDCTFTAYKVLIQ